MNSPVIFIAGGAASRVGNLHCQVRAVSVPNRLECRPHFPICKKNSPRPKLGRGRVPAETLVKRALATAHDRLLAVRRIQGCCLRRRLRLRLRYSVSGSRVSPIFERSARIQCDRFAIWQFDATIAESVPHRHSEHASQTQAHIDKLCLWHETDPGTAKLFAVLVEIHWPPSMIITSRMLSESNRLPSTIESRSRRMRDMTTLLVVTDFGIAPVVAVSIVTPQYGLPTNPA